MCIFTNLLTLLCKYTHVMVYLIFYCFFSHLPSDPLFFSLPQTLFSLHLHSSSPSPSHSLTHPSSKQDKVVQPPHLSQKSHLYQTPKPKSNYTHNSKQQKPNKITKSPNPRENPKLKAFCLWLLIG